MRRKAEAALFFNTILWGTTFSLVKETLSDLSPFLFLALRFSLAAAALALLLRRPGAARWTRGSAAAGCLCGVFLFTGYALQTLGLRLTSAPKSAFLTGLTSVMVPFVGALVYKTRPQVSEIAGLLVATGGLALMTLEGTVGSISRGDLLTILCAIAFAAQIVTVGHFSPQMSFELLSFTQVAAAALLACSMFWWIETPKLALRPLVACAILITGLLATALAFTIQSWAFRYTTASRAALIYLLEPVFAWLTSYVWAGAGLSGRAAAGAGLILGGVMMVELKPLKPRAHPSDIVTAGKESDLPGIPRSGNNHELL